MTDEVNERLQELRVLRTMAKATAHVIDQRIDELEQRQDDKTDAKIEHHRQTDHGIAPVPAGQSVLEEGDTLSGPEVRQAFCLEQEGATLEEIAVALGHTRYAVEAAMARRASQHRQYLRSISGDAPLLFS